MRQEYFSDHHKQRWARLERCIDGLEGRGKASEEQPNAEFPALYRNACHHLAIARRRAYSRALLDRLHKLVSRAHRLMYAPRRRFGSGAVAFIMQGFPRAVMERWRFVMLAALLFFGPMVALFVGVQAYPDLAYTVLDGRQARSLERMYSPENRERYGRERESESDVLMFGFYLRNNTGIGFRTFAGGMLFGIGTMFFLLFNGIQIGAAAGHMVVVGNGTPFWSFVAGHSGFELIAIVLSGASGLILGFALLRPGRLTRRRALRESALQALPILYGAAGLFLIAAFIEAFWSSIVWISPMVKYGVGIGCWVVLPAYFVGLGLRRAT